MTHPPSGLPEANTDFFEKYICCDINASIRFSKFPNELKQRDIVPAHKIKSKLFKGDYMGISVHKTELVNCGSIDPPVNLQGVDFETRSQINNLVARTSQLLLKMW